MIGILDFIAVGSGNVFLKEKYFPSFPISPVASCHKVKQSDIKNRKVKYFKKLSLIKIKITLLNLTKVLNVFKYVWMRFYQYFQVLQVMQCDVNVSLASFLYSDV